jgi:hypothetical protein
MPARRPSNLRSQLVWLPRPSTTPRATTSICPGFAAFRRVDAMISAAALGSSTRTADRSAAVRGFGSGRRERRCRRGHDVAAGPPNSPAPASRAPAAPRRGLPRARALENVPGVEPVVLEHPNQVRVTGPGPGNPPAPQIPRCALRRHHVFPVGPVEIARSRATGRPAARPRATVSHSISPAPASFGRRARSPASGE